MKIAYGKIGRSIPLDFEAASNVGGDAEVIRLLHLLLERGHEVHLIGRNRNDFTHPNLVNHWAPGGILADPPPPSREHGAKAIAYTTFFRERARQLPQFDATLIWLGQHGSSLHPVPAVQGAKGGYTHPLLSDINYGHPIVTVLNELNIQPHFLCPDPRNMVKFRDLWEPRQKTILAQYNTSKDNTFWDAPSNKLRSGGTRYEYAGIELLAVPYDSMYTPPTVPPERLFGLLVNEGYSNLGDKGRLHLVQNWTKGLDEFEIFGTWCEKSQQALGRVITTVPLRDVTATLQRWRATMTFPATNSGWATAKPWECFKAGVVCFKHPRYDSQGHIYSSKHMPSELHSFLTPSTMSAFHSRLEELKDDDRWRQMVLLQFQYYQDSVRRLDHGMRMILESIGAITTGG